MLLRLYAKSSAFGLSGEHRQQAGRVDCADEEHRQEEQPAAQKDCGEQAVLHVAQLLADDADEPQEGNPGKWHEVGSTG